MIKAKSHSQISWKSQTFDYISLHKYIIILLKSVRSVLVRPSLGLFRHRSLFTCIVHWNVQVRGI